MELEAAAQLARDIRERLAKVIVGQDEVLDQTIIALLCGGHVLLEGPPGTAKTLLVRALATIVQAEFRRIQFTPDLMPADVIGVNVYAAQSGTFEFRAGPVFTDLLLADEINRAPAKTQSSLLEAMQDMQVSVDGVEHRLSRIFTVFATQNPIEYEGTYPLPEAQLDRFLFKTLVRYPDAEQEQGILHRYLEGFDARKTSTFGVESCVTVDQLDEMRNALAQVTVADEIVQYIIGIVRATRDYHSVMVGASPRAAVMLLQASRAAAMLDGRNYVTPDDVRDLAAPALRHRIVLNPETEIEGTTADEVIAQLLTQAPVPRL